MKVVNEIKENLKIYNDTENETKSEAKGRTIGMRFLQNSIL